MSKTIALNRFRFGVLVFINCPFLQNGSQDAIDGSYIVGNLGGVVERPKLADPCLSAIGGTRPIRDDRLSRQRTFESWGCTRAPRAELWTIKLDPQPFSCRPNAKNDKESVLSAVNTILYEMRSKDERPERTWKNGPNTGAA